MYKYKIKNIKKNIKYYKIFNLLIKKTYTKIYLKTYKIHLIKSII